MLLRGVQRIWGPKGDVRKLICCVYAVDGRLIVRGGTRGEAGRTLGLRRENGPESKLEIADFCDIAEIGQDLLGQPGRGLIILQGGLARCAYAGQLYLRKEGWIRERIGHGCPGQPDVHVCVEVVADDLKRAAASDASGVGAHIVVVVHNVAAAGQRKRGRGRLRAAWNTEKNDCGEQVDYGGALHCAGVLNKHCKIYLRTSMLRAKALSLNTKGLRCDGAPRT